MSSIATKVGGTVYLTADGTQYNAKGAFTYNIGGVKREAVVGADGVHGFKESQQVPFIEGEVTDNADLSLSELTGIESATVTLELANGKVITLSQAWYAGEGTGNTEEGNIGVRFEGMSGEES